MRGKYDVILIGGGISSLTAGNYLSHMGLKTIIFERNSKVGGYVTSFQRRGYTFEAGLTSFGSNGIVFPILQELGIPGEYIPVKRQLITDSFNGQIAGSFQELKTVMLAAYPEDRGDIEKFFCWAEMVSEGFTAVWNLPFISGKWNICEVATLPFRHVNFCKFFLQYLHRTKQDLSRQFFKNPELVAVMDKVGYPVMTAIVTAGMWYSFKSDYWYPKKGMQAFSNQLAEKYQSTSGEIKLNSRVEKILQDGGRVRGIKLTSGEVVESSAVFADIDLRTVFLQLLDVKAFSSAFLDKLRTGEPSESMFTVFLGLKGKGFAASPYNIRSSHCWFSLKNAAGERDEFAVNIPTLDDPALAPQGEAVIVSCFEEYSDWRPLKNRNKEYYRLKEERIEKVLSFLRRVLPDLDARLEVLEGASPLTYEQYSGNFKGATAGWSWNPRLRPEFNWRTEGKVPGLYLAGQWVYNPGGVPSAMITARMAAMRCLKEFTR